MAAHEQVARQLPRVLSQLEQLDRALGALDSRLRSLEVDLRTSSQRWDSAHASLAERLDATEARANAQELRLQGIERDRDVAKALAKRERKKSGGLGAALGTVAGAVASFLYNLLK
jgi:chromosome segregation ATPase